MKKREIIKILNKKQERLKIMLESKNIQNKKIINLNKEIDDLQNKLMK